MKIGTVVPSHNPNPLYRAVMPMEELGRRGHTIGSLVLSDPSRLPSLEAFLSFDVVYFWQVHHPPVRRIAKALHDAGIAVIWDSDDDVTALPRGSPNYRQFGGMRGQRTWVEMQTMIRLADAVTTPSPMLAERFRTVGQRHVHVIENQLPIVSPPKLSGAEGVVVGWVAGLEHGTDVKALDLRSVFSRVLDARPDVRVETVGVTLDLGSSRYRRTRIVQLAELASQIERFDIGVAPLADTPFNRARSNIKLKEYAALGVPWLASPVGPYLGLGEDQGGRLVEDDRWFEEVVSLVAEGESRARLA
jgi:glycosyltransferase involved in cell wall biosynthesis